ncbi:protein of unknown function [Paenisporosarcina quisquiliarum]|jgi:hypothetical protein|uniref:DUF3870 domain-containing protein n=1 Tax=Psychrobacillus psychrodurans TaxID=126157 RepID=A0A9X3LA70_9BACI|nr:DUF3870 domain-containing protein [Psychrobacillus psychrodurans]MCZ8534232.1 DUF3870 domain-containing protein [Psychrobacillus psychrodurans]MCZ8541375.1 DUF3870 domain-containing protein [Psychrobacillus psychrodurans]SEN57339.1 protein of unknown function [Paenisporosarcina quisquiliarum]SFM97344.1 protein of unknown function [Psychrobacillus psychrodurans]
MQQLNTLLVTAYAKAPQGTAMYEIYKHAGIVLEIDKQTHKIVDAEFTFITELAQNFFKRMLINFDFTADINILIERIEEHYMAPSSGAVTVALKSAQKRYLEKIAK